MNWITCSKTSEGLFQQSRFSLPRDGVAGFNCDSGLSISDITGGIAWLVTYMGDAVLRNPYINKFLELEPNHTGGFLSGFISLVIVFGVLLVFGIIEAAFEALFR